MMPVTAISRIVAVTVVMVGLASAAATSQTIIELRQAGWVVTDHSERVEARDPLAHYGQARHEVVISDYRLTKDGAVMRCFVSYDNHLDKIEQGCTAGE